MPCKEGSLIEIPDDTAARIAPGYPQHNSSDWRDRAEVLPRFTGAYVYTTSRSGGLLKASRFRDRCLYFSDRGIMFDIMVNHSGYKKNFQEQVLRHSPKNDRGGPDNWRGLYSVDGHGITCSLTEIKGMRYGFTGTISADGSWMRLKRTDARGRKGQILSDDYTFHAIEGLTPFAATPLPPPVPEVVIRRRPHNEPLGLPVADSPFRPLAGDADQETFDVILESAGRRQVAVIKAIRASSPSHVGLSEAKAHADNTPSLIMHNVDQETAAKAKTLLEAAGATVTVHPDLR
jgi:ribosomal protein L7/L12